MHRRLTLISRECVLLSWGFYVLAGVWRWGWAGEQLVFDEDAAPSLRVSRFVCLHSLVIGLARLCICCPLCGSFSIQPDSNDRFYYLELLKCAQSVWNVVIYWRFNIISQWKCRLKFKKLFDWQTKSQTNSVYVHKCQIKPSFYIGQTGTSRYSGLKTDNQDPAAAFPTEILFFSLSWDTAQWFWPKSAVIPTDSVFISYRSTYHWSLKSEEISLANHVEPSSVCWFDLCICENLTLSGLRH